MKQLTMLLFTAIINIGLWQNNGERKISIVKNQQEPSTHFSDAKSREGTTYEFFDEKNIQVAVWFVYPNENTCNYELFSWNSTTSQFNYFAVISMNQKFTPIWKDGQPAIGNFSMK